MASSSVFGVLCRIVWLSSLLWQDRNSITLEFSTPSSQAPDGIGLCFTDSAYTQQSDAIAVSSLQSSDSLFLSRSKQPWREELVLSAQSRWQSSPFFGKSSPSPLATTSPHGLLSSDPFYSSSFEQTRCGDEQQLLLLLRWGRHMHACTASALHT